MEKLITTVQERYGRAVSYRGLMTLVYREKAVVSQSTDTEEGRKRGFLGLLRPQLQGMSKSLHQEISKLLDRRDKLLLQMVTRDVPKIIGLNTSQMRSDSLRSEKALDRAVRLEKRVELLTADIGAKNKAAQRELERLRMAEKARTREEERAAYEQPIIERNTQRRISREAEREREELRREVGFELIKTERRIAQKLRDDEEYEKRRRG